MKLTQFEIAALRMLNGDVPMQGGAWLNACCEFLQEGGYVTRMPYRVTDKGKQFLSAPPHPRREGVMADVDIVEVIAEEIYKARNGHGCRAWGSLPNSHKEPYRLDARAALSALTAKGNCDGPLS